MDSFRNYYHVLGVAPTADDAAIKAAFRRLALRHHPDIARDKRATRRFLGIREAFEVLSDPEKRRQYDRVSGVQKALRPVEAGLERPQKGTRGGAGAGRRLGITLNVLGLSVSLSVDAALRPPGARRPRSVQRRPKRSAQ
jgi:curved DNA-binding protein